MTIGRICTREIHTAEAGDTIRQAAERMRDERVGTLLVLEEDGRPTGILTDRDICMRVVATGKDPERNLVADIMTAAPETVHEDEPIEDALSKMRAHGRRRMVVVDDHDVAVGIVALDDVLELLAEEMEQVGQLLGFQEPAKHPAEPGETSSGSFTSPASRPEQ